MLDSNGSGKRYWQRGQTMIVNFHSRGRGGGAGPVDYLLGKDRNRDGATILQEKQEKVRELIDASAYAESTSPVSRHTGCRSGQSSTRKRWSRNDHSGCGRMTAPRYEAPNPEQGMIINF